jgi:protein-S-isoprenylcysteine O-methyltransferase Ste14
MAIFGGNPALTLYLVLHGSYGLFWVYKDVAFGDRSFAREAPVITHVVCCIVLLFYWMTALLIATGRAIQEPSQARSVACLAMYGVGLWLMMASDHHKNTRLKVKPGLITDGLFSRTRNPNYLGEMLIYGSFAGVGGHAWSYLLLGFVWSTLFLVNMLAKDYSLSQKKGWL